LSVCHQFGIPFFLEYNVCVVNALTLAHPYSSIPTFTFLRIACTYFINYIERFMVERERLGTEKADSQPNLLPYST